jgi:ABC-2 type transport system ATP-binding protein
MDAIEIKNLTKKYQNCVAVADLSIQIAERQIFGFVGPDGAGKTSLFQMLCGILSANGGKIRALGIEVFKNPEQLKQRLGYLSQKFSLYSDLTVLENVDFFAALFKTPRHQLGRKEQLLEFAGLGRFKQRLAGNLSGGMKQKLALCCSLIHTPELLVLDEPTTGVDPVSRQEFWEMLKPLPAQGTTVIVSTAYMDEAEQCDQIALLNGGRLMQIGTPDTLKKPLTGKIFAIKGPGLGVLRTQLNTCAFINEVQEFGDCLHLQIQPDLCKNEGQERIAAFLEEKGYPATVTAIQPSMEDVFVALLLAKCQSEVGRCLQ